MYLFAINYIHITCTDSVIEKIKRVQFLPHRIDLDNFSRTTGCCVFSGGCSYFWTAGQRIDPSRNTAFIWRMKTASSYREKVSQMSYTNWNSGEPNYAGQTESCVISVSYRSYRWNDATCSDPNCSICEIDI